jgi:hypothetical protein
MRSIIIKSVICFFPVLFLFISCSGDKELEADVLVIGGTTSGISAGIQSARLGVETLIIEETEWLGGMITAAGVSAFDGNHNLHSGIWNEFRSRLRQHYGGASALATGWVSNTLFEPHVGDSIFKAMATETKGLKMLYGYHVTAVMKRDNKVVGALFQDESGRRLTVRAKVVVDATDLGDGLFFADAEYDLGMDSRFSTGEENAPEKANNIIQDLTWVAILKDFGKGSDNTIAKPAGYNPELYRGSCSMTVDSILIDCEKMLTYGRLPNNKYMINWPRKGNDIYLNVVEMNREERKKELKKAKDQTLGFVYYIQTELGFKNLGLADDEFPTSDRLALVPYHREGRRLKGIEQLTIKSVIDRYKGKPLYRTGISVGDYPVDHHHNANPAAPVITFPRVPSFNIPIGSLIPKNIDGLIVSDKAISVSNIMNGATRLQPVVLLTGQAAGVMAAMSVTHNINVREVSIRQVQQTLLGSGAYLMPLFDISPDDPDFEPIQRVTSSGILEVTGEPYQWANRTWFHPDSVILMSELCEGLNSYENRVLLENDSNPATTGKVIAILSGMLAKDVSAEVNEVLMKRSGRKTDTETPLTKRNLAVIIDEILNPFGKEIGFDGQFR